MSQLLMLQYSCTVHLENNQARIVDLTPSVPSRERENECSCYIYSSNTIEGHRKTFWFIQNYLFSKLYIYCLWDLDRNILILIHSHNLFQLIWRQYATVLLTSSRCQNPEYIVSLDAKNVRSWRVMFFSVSKYLPIIYNNILKINSKMYNFK